MTLSLECWRDGDKKDGGELRHDGTSRSIVPSVLGYRERDEFWEDTEE